MAWNPSPEVAAARDYAKKFGQDRVIIITVDHQTGTMGYVTYGKTRALCDDTQRLGEAAYQAVFDELAKDCGKDEERERWKRQLMVAKTHEEQRELIRKLTTG